MKEVGGWGKKKRKKLAIPTARSTCQEQQHLYNMDVSKWELLASLRCLALHTLVAGPVMQHARDLLLGSKIIAGKTPPFDVRHRCHPFFLHLLGCCIICVRTLPFLNGRQYISVLYAPDMTNEFPSSLADIPIVQYIASLSVSHVLPLSPATPSAPCWLIYNERTVDCEWAFTSHLSWLALDVCQLACIHILLRIDEMPTIQQCAT